MDQIYQLHITLVDSHPPIWRRIQVAEDTTFYDLHRIIQIAMGWSNDHLYEFRIKMLHVVDSWSGIDEDDPTQRDSMEVSLNELVNRVKSSFIYHYDFGDDWMHKIVLEKKLQAEPGKLYPICLEGERACPPEDSGGIYGYYHKLQAIEDPNHPNHTEMMEWMGDEDWDADLFELDAINERMCRYLEYRAEMLSKEEADDDDEVDESDDWEETYDEDDYDVSDYDYARQFSSPADLLDDPTENPALESVMALALQKPDSQEYQTMERLRNLGFDHQRAVRMMMEALAIEWFYDAKCGIFRLDDRYEWNLQHLPETPQELPRQEDALAVLNQTTFGVPYSAIEYLQNDPTATEAILKALYNHSDHQYCWEECTLAPLWYAVAAEGHLCEALIDPVIQLYQENPHESDWLNEQGEYLIGKLAEKYPELTAQKVLEAMEKDASDPNMPHIFYLFDAFYFCDIAPFKSRLLALLKREDLPWLEPLAYLFAQINLQEGLPVLKAKLQQLKRKPENDYEYRLTVPELESNIRMLESASVRDNEHFEPFCLRRKAWRDYLEEGEYLFYEEDRDEPLNFPDFGGREQIDTPLPTSSWPGAKGIEPFIKPKAPERNDPCPCGSGKKYKKCCIDKYG